jgi:hypothetical protein
MAITHTTIKVTPELATQWLNQCNTHNRALANGIVKEYAAQMAAGRWRLNGESIIFTKDKKRLLDGQHRLWACIEADTPFVTVVAEGVPEETFPTIDTGKKRSPKDVLDIDGLESGDNRALGAAATAIIRYQSGSVAGNQVIPKYAILEFARANPELTDWIKRAKANKGWTTAYASPLAAVMYLASHKYPHKTEEFVEQFTTGENLTIKSPALALRNRLGTEKRLQTPTKLALIIGAWNAFATNRELAKVQLPKKDSPFPKIVGAKKAA